MTFELHAYQKRALLFALRSIRECGGAGLLLDMGLGKTLTSIALMDVMHADDPKARFLVVAPPQAAQDTWPAELEKFSGIHHLDWVCAAGAGRQGPAWRKGIVDQGATVTIISQGCLAWLDRTYKQWPWSGIVVDELTGYKSSGSQRFRILRRRRRGLDWLVGLTGTPAAGGLADLWAQLYLIDGGKSLGRSVTAFRRQWFHPGRTGWNGRQQIVYQWDPNDGAYEQIMDAIRPCCLTMLAGDELPDLPKSVTIDHDVAMPKATRALYERFKEDSVVTVDDSDITASSAGVLTQKLGQFAAGCLYPDADDPEGTVRHLDDAKLDCLQEIIDESAGEQILVFYQYRDELRRMRERWPFLREVKEPGVVADWDEGRVPLLAAHPSSAKFGLNLQHRGHIVVWLSLTWSLEDYTQANARLDRQGQTRPVQIHRILEPDTIDERKVGVLEGHAALQDAVMDELKATRRGDADRNDAVL